MQETHEQTERRSTELLAVGSTELDTADVPERILVVPWGDVTSSNGTFTVDGESGREVVAAFEKNGNDIPVDYEHQTLGGEFASPDGRAPAAGWIKELEIVDGAGIFAHVEWTDRGRAMLAAKEYRYLSPVALVDRQTRRIVAIHSAALTNKPAITAMQPIVNADRTPVAADLDSEDTDLDRNTEPISVVCVDRLRDQLELDEETPSEDVLFTAYQMLGRLRNRARRQRAEALVRTAMNRGKCSDAQREWATTLALRSPEEFQAWQASAPVIVRTGRIDPPTFRNDRDRRADAIVNRARTEYRQQGLLQQLTSEEAYVASAMRDAGLNETA